MWAVRVDAVCGRELANCSCGPGAALSRPRGLKLWPARLLARNNWPGSPSRRKGCVNRRPRTRASTWSGCGQPRRCSCCPWRCRSMSTLAPAEHASAPTLTPSSGARVDVAELSASGGVGSMRKNARRLARQRTSGDARSQLASWWPSPVGALPTGMDWLELRTAMGPRPVFEVGQRGA